MLRGLFGRGASRRLLAVLAYGTLAQRADNLRQELAELQKIAAAQGAVIAGLSHGALIERAEDAKARIGELLPYGAPDDWALAVSKPILDEYERKMRDIGHKVAGPRGRDPLTDDELVEARAVIAAITAEVVEVPAVVPEYVDNDRDDDHFVHAALLGHASAIVTDDRHLVPKGEDSVRYTDPELERSVTAMNLGPFAGHCLERGVFELSQVDPGLLTAAVGELTRA